MKPTLLNTIPSDIKKIINYYCISINNLATLPLDKVEIEWLLSVRREIVVTSFGNWNTCTTQFWTLPVDFFSDCDSCISRSWITYSGCCGDTTDYKGEEIIDRNVFIESLIETQIPFVFPRTILTDDCTLLDVKSIFLILKARFNKIDKELSVRYCHVTILKFLGDLEKYIGRGRWKRFLIEKYLYSNAITMELNTENNAHLFRDRIHHLLAILREAIINQR